MRKCNKGKASLLILSFFLIFFVFFILYSQQCYAGTASKDTAVLTVRLDGVDKEYYSLEDLQGIAAGEGNKVYTYSVWNTYPTYSKVENVQGPTVAGILSSAGIASIENNCIVTFASSKNEKAAYKWSLTEEQYNATRYYYHDAGTYRPGNTAVGDYANFDREVVPIVVRIYKENDAIKTKLCIGQIAPNEENNPLWVSGIAGEETKGGNGISGGGVISIYTNSTLNKCVPVSQTSTTHVRTGEEITLTDFDNKYIRDGSYKNNSYYDKVYYSYDNEPVGYGSRVYNNGPQNYEISKPVFTSEGEHTLNILVKGYGKLDSEISHIKFNVCNGDAVNNSTWGYLVNGYDVCKCSKCGLVYSQVYHEGYSTSYVKSFKVSKGKKQFKAKWKKQNKKTQKNFSGYQIRYSTSPGFEDAAWINVKKTKNSYSRKKLVSKTRYYVQLRSYVITSTGVVGSTPVTKSVVVK